MRHRLLIALVAATAFLFATPALAIKPSQTFVRPFDATFEFSNDEGTCAFEVRSVETQIFRVFYDRQGNEVRVTEQGRTEVTLTDLLTGEMVSGFNSLNLRSTPFDLSTVEVGDIITLRDKLAGLNAVLFPPGQPPIVLAGRSTSEVVFRVLVNDPASGEFEAELVSESLFETANFGHFIGTGIEPLLQLGESPPKAALPH